jgi:D-alanyl-D-alanine carboxypeptidase
VVHLYDQILSLTVLGYLFLEKIEVATGGRNNCATESKIHFKLPKIMTTKIYSVEKSGPDWQNRRSYRWENTHKMNGQSGVISVKTGITQAAGPCLATAVEFEAGIKLVIVLLCAKDMDCRWLETHKLGKWATKRLSQIKSFGKSGT